MKKFSTLLLGLTLAGSLGVGAVANADEGRRPRGDRFEHREEARRYVAPPVAVPVIPPARARRAEARPVAFRERIPFVRGYVWIPGSYQWIRGRWIFLPGHYERVRPELYHRSFFVR